MSRHSCSRPAAPRAMRGFTLLEVLVAVSMLAIVLTSIYGVFTGVSATKQRLDSDSADYHLARVLFDRLGRELHGTYFRPNDATTVLRGGIDERGEPFLELTTTAVTPLSMTGTGIARIAYRLISDPERNDGSKVLLRGERPRHTNDPLEVADMMRLAPGVLAMKLRFFAAGQWQEQWDARQAGLPELVEISFLVGPAQAGQVPFATTFELPDVVVQ